MTAEARTSFDVEPMQGARNRLTVAFRPLLALPHALFVGGPGIGIGLSGDRTGVFGIAAGVGALINWFAIVFTGKPVGGLFELQASYLRWRANVLAYEAMLRDEYPPFGAGAYPVTASFPIQNEDRNRWSVGLRLFLALPQIIVVSLLLAAWILSAIAGWLVTLLTGEYPQSLWRFGLGTMRWVLRLEVYLLLLNDDYPPYSLDA